MYAICGVRSWFTVRIRVRRRLRWEPDRRTRNPQDSRWWRGCGFPPCRYTVRRSDGRFRAGRCGPASRADVPHGVWATSRRACVVQTRPKTAASMWSRPTAYRPRSSARWGRPRADRQKDRTPRHRMLCTGVPFCMRRWRCTSRFGPWGKGVRTGPHRQFSKKHFHFGGKYDILYDRIGEMNSSGAARRLRNGQFC